jgi:hypothetical protein
MIGFLAVSLAFSACTGGPSPSGSAAGPSAASSSGGLGTRELTPQEKRVIIDALSSSIRDPGSAKYKWAKFPLVPSDDVNYCAMVNAKSPYPAYSGWQNYIVEAKVSGGQISSAVVGLIAGGKDAALVTKMCAKYGLNPNDAN